jgi:ABC-type cobalamin/Fe3+-siderophores transport system ATPase subunit
MEELFKYIIEILTKFLNLFKAHLDEIIYGGILGGILTAFIIYSFTKIKNAIYYLFSNVLKTKRQKRESVHVEGAIVINRQFLKDIQRIALKQRYEAEDFYLAKQYENCQWYGILNNWDIERNVYKKLIEELKKSFSDEFRQPKIIALILGRGGSGKTTLLRRVAVDSVQSDFCTLWINDKEISKFYEKGINDLGHYSKTKFLILIEDWYRIKQNTAYAKEIIDNLCNYSNVRILIGDRTLDNSVSREHIFNPDENIVELKVNENKKTIAEILKKVPQWKETSESVLTIDNDYNSTLYLILWVIARIRQDKNGSIIKNTIKKEGLSGHFQTIVESDLRIIAKHYPGFAKALYYYGSIYSEYRIYFGLSTFLKIADEFNEKEIDNRLAFVSKEIKPILNIYINTTKGLFKSAGDLSLVAFNHDILTDEGLSKAQIAEWHKFDESILLQILPIIIKNGDGFSASNYFFTTLNKTNTQYFPNEDRLKYLNALVFDKKNRGYYLNALFNGTILISEDDKVNYITTILNDFLNFDFSTPTICNCLNYIKNHPAAKKTAAAILSQPDFFKLPFGIVSTAMNIIKDKAERQKAATAILSQPDFFKLPFQIVSTAMNISRDEPEQQKAAKAILSQPDFYKLPFQIVSTAMNVTKDKAEQQKAATTILSQPDFFKLPYQIVSTAMNVSKDKDEQQKAATAILSQPDFFKLSQEIVSTAMNISRNEIEQQKAATAILSQPGFFKLPQEIVSTAMNISRDEIEQEKAAMVILSQPDFFKLPFGIVSTALNISRDKAEQQKAAATILSQPDFFKLPYQIVSTAMNVSKGEAEQQKAATAILSQPDFFKLPHQIVSSALNISRDICKAEYFLKKWESTSWGIVYQSLFCFAGNTNYPQFIHDIVNTIITSKSKGGGFYFRYVQLLKIPFHGINIWEEECNNLIRNYNCRSNAMLINCVLYSHRSIPDKIENICTSILKNWKTEIVKPINQIYGPPHYGDNIKIAMGHPNLKISAKKTAEEILISESESPGTIKDYLVDIAHKIVSTEKYPEWNNSNNNEKIIE